MANDLSRPVSSVPTVAVIVRRTADLQASLRPSLRLSLNWRSENRTTEAYGYDRVLLACTVGEDVSIEDLHDGLDKATAACAPMTISEAARMLGMLRVMVRSRSEGMDLNAQIKLYAAKLIEWPADAVAVVLASWADDHEFWPTWSELRATLVVLTGDRIMLRDAIRQALVAKQGA